jgi:CubicO group peptidase (beta-lactamase class C family)
MCERLRTRIDQLLQACVDRGDVPGITAAAANTEGVTYTGGAGTLNPDSVVWIASMTKTVTSLAALQQVQAGTLNLDAPLADVLPELAELTVLTGFDDRGGPLTRSPKTAPTLRQALSHTAGWAYEFWNADVARYHETRGVPPIIACLDQTLTVPLMNDPGTVWQYGLNIDWAGKAVERVTGRRLPEYLAEHVFTPLGMPDTGFVVGDRRDRLAGMNARLPEGGSTPVEFEMPRQPQFHMGGGGLYSTAHDYLRFLRALLGGGRLDGVRVLDADLLEQARTNQIGELTIGPIGSVAPDISYDFDLLPGTAKKWGLLGMLNTEDTPAGRRAGSLTWAGLSNCYFWVDWAGGDAGVLCSQLLPFADPKVLATFAEFETAVHAG